VPAREVVQDAPTSLVGEVVLGRYRVVRPLARGGMGVVYLGRLEGDAGFAKPVVIKSVLAVGRKEEGEQLFAREARIVSNLQHPGIVSVIDFGNVDGTPVMVLEYVHGYHLGQWLRFVNETRGSMPVPHAVHVVLAVLESLAYAHGLVRPDGSALGIVHRDISPGNVLIDVNGHVKLSDFGIARIADDEFKTQEGLFRGTLAFAAPEAVRGTPPDAKMDQYSTAVLFYQLLAGKNPFRGTEAHETMFKVLTELPPSLASLRDDVPDEIDAAILRALAKEPEERFASVTEFARAIRAGCSWPEHEAEEAFAHQIEQDFRGDGIAARLDVEPLSVRDASWREAQEVVSARVSLSSSPPGLRSEVITHKPGPHEPEPPLAVTKPAVTIVKPSNRAGSVDSRSSLPRVERGKRLGLWIALAALVAGVGSAGVMALVTRGAPQPASRVLVIEKQEVANAPGEPMQPAATAVTPPPPEPALAAAAPLAAPSGAEPSPPAPAGKARSAPAAAPANRGAELARAFQRQQAQIQGCFRQQGSGQAEPSISVHFQVDTTGAVKSASVSPASVAGTPLGQCLASVARGTAFGPQPDNVSFVIPIAARVVNH